MDAFESAEFFHWAGHGGILIGDIHLYHFIALTLSCVLHVNTNRGDIIGRHLGLINPQAAIIERGVAQTEAKRVQLRGSTAEVITEPGRGLVIIEGWNMTGIAWIRHR